jgi:hypothetical protein
MRPSLFCKNFPGVHISIREIHKHPCPTSHLAKHIHVGYRLVQFKITPENPFVIPSFQWLKLITVKPTWNIKLREQCPNFIAIERDDVILDIGYQLGKHQGMVVDFVLFTVKNLCDGTQTNHKAFIKHTAGSQSSNHTS